ncbi:MAG: hypothetical protein EOP04_13790 [Proteobacteria bacterium]|nr:MAG: hypothetical protein EOP04_13790 [Pseudomonadota bacterium]
MNSLRNLTHIRIERHFRVRYWDATTKNSAMDFWSRRGMAFQSTPQDLLLGKRGHLLGNLTSFNMTKLMSNLTVTVDGTNVEAVLVVNKLGQSITDWNRAWWNLEMEIFESHLLSGDNQEERWAQFLKEYKSQAWIWTASLGKLGNEVPPDKKLFQFVNI